jgi:endonuclease III-like uncharacterized protein
MTTDYKVTELFCVIDEFCKHFNAENAYCKQCSVRYYILSYL